ncbi:MAG TPA: hypothetical protein VIB48_16130 [Acidimicrobiia bacterium]|jgi:hypothetical protein
MGEKGNVAAAASQGGGLLDTAVDAGTTVVSTGSDVLVEGASNAVSGVVHDRVRERIDRRPDDEPDETPA